MKYVWVKIETFETLEPKTIWRVQVFDYEVPNSIKALVTSKAELPSASKERT